MWAPLTGEYVRACTDSASEPIRARVLEVKSDSCVVLVISAPQKRERISVKLSCVTPPPPTKPVEGEWKFCPQHAMWKNVSDGTELSQWGRDQPMGRVPKCDDEVPTWDRNRGTFVWTGATTSQTLSHKQPKHSTGRKGGKSSWSEDEKRIVVKHMDAHPKDREGAGKLVGKSEAAVRLQLKRMGYQEGEDEGGEAEGEHEDNGDGEDDDDDEEEEEEEEEDNDDDKDEDYVGAPVQRSFEPLVPKRDSCKRFTNRHIQMILALTNSLWR